MFQGQRVTLESEVVRYFMCWSVIVMTSWKTTDYFLKGTEGQTRALIASTAVTLLAGWWGIPFGIVLTPFYLIRNVIGGEKSTVAKLIGIMENPTEFLKKKDDEQFAPAKVFLAIVGGIVLLGFALQIYIYLRKMFQH